MLLPPLGREREREQVQGQAQQLESEPVLVPEPPGRQAQQPPSSQQVGPAGVAVHVSRDNQGNDDRPPAEAQVHAVD